MTVTASRTSLGVDPLSLYTRRGFMLATGLCEMKLREAKRLGIECRRFWVGKRCFYRGSDIITFLEELSSAESQRQFETAGAAR